MPLSPHDARAGTLVADRYELREPIGRGGAGVVYEGVDVETGRRVAVKLLNPEHVGNAEVARRLLHEARTTSTLADPHVVEVIDAGTDAEGEVYLVLEFLEGESLAARRHRRRALPPAEVLALLLPLFDTLVSAHWRGVVHRDLKPENIFIARDGRGGEIAKLLDFGVAKVLGAETNGTRTGVVLGTPLYMAPEQAVGAPDINAQADVWAMGVVLYECLTGWLPHRAPDDGREVLEVIAHDAPVPLAACRPRGVTLALAAAIDGALQRDRARRHASMEAFRDAVLAAMAPAAAEPGPAAATARYPALAASDAARTIPATRAAGARARAGGRGSIALGALAAIASMALAAWVKTRAPAPPAQQPAAPSAETARAEPPPAADAAAPNRPRSRAASSRTRARSSDAHRLAHATHGSSSRRERHLSTR